VQGFYTERGGYRLRSPEGKIRKTGKRENKEERGKIRDKN
jgi:hypothetical protein